MLDGGGSNGRAHPEPSPAPARPPPPPPPPPASPPRPQAQPILPAVTARPASRYTHVSAIVRQPILVLVCLFLGLVLGIVPITIAVWVFILLFVQSKRHMLVFLLTRCQTASPHMWKPALFRAATHLPCILGSCVFQIYCNQDRSPTRHIKLHQQLPGPRHSRSLT